MPSATSNPVNQRPLPQNIILGTGIGTAAAGMGMMCSVTSTQSPTSLSSTGTNTPTPGPSTHVQLYAPIPASSGSSLTCFSGNNLNGNGVNNSGFSSGGAGVGMGVGSGVGGLTNGCMHGPGQGLGSGHIISPTAPLTVSIGTNAGGAGGSGISQSGAALTLNPGSTSTSNGTFLIGNSDKDKTSAFGKLFHYVNEMKKELENAQKQRREGQLETQRLREKCQQLDDRLAVEHSKSAGLEDRLDRAKTTQRTLRSQVNTSTNTNTNAVSK